MNQAPKLTYTLEDSGLRWEILSHVDLPGGALTWLRVLPAARDLATAMLVKDLVIEETGVVALLRICNTTREPVLLPTDLVVDGGKQARVIERSVIVPAFAVADVPVRCVEAGRWHARDEKSATRFSMTGSASIQSREHLTKLKQRSYQEGKQYTLDQREVWSHVSSELRKTSTSSDTQSYTAFLSTRAARLAEARKLDIQPPACANGLAVVKPNGGVWIEAFPTREAMGSIVATVVADVLEDPLIITPKVKAGDALLRADSAMREIGGSSLAPLPPTPATIGECFSLDGRHVAGQVLLFANRVAHLVASVG